MLELENFYSEVACISSYSNIPASWLIISGFNYLYKYSSQSTDINFLENVMYLYVENMSLYFLSLVIMYYLR